MNVNRFDPVSIFTYPDAEHAAMTVGRFLKVRDFCHSVSLSLCPSVFCNSYPLEDLALPSAYINTAFSVNTWEIHPLRMQWSLFGEDTCNSKKNDGSHVTVRPHSIQLSRMGTAYSLYLQPIISVLFSLFVTFLFKIFRPFVSFQRAQWLLFLWLGTIPPPIPSQISRRLLALPRKSPIQFWDQRSFKSLPSELVYLIKVN